MIHMVSVPVLRAVRVWWMMVLVVVVAAVSSGITEIVTYTLYRKTEGAAMLGLLEYASPSLKPPGTNIASLHSQLSSEVLPFFILHNSLPPFLLTHTRATISV